jgi:hypothetical protein
MIVRSAPAIIVRAPSAHAPNKIANHLMESEAPRKRGTQRPFEQQMIEEANTVEDRALRAARRREKRRLRMERAEWWSSKMHAFLWVAGAIATVILSDFVNVCLTNKDLYTAPLYLGLALLVLVVLAVIRMAVWFPKEGEPQADFEKAHPTFTLATTFGGVLCFFLLSIGLWPAYKIFGPFMLLLYWFGLIMSLHFVP